MLQGGLGLHEHQPKPEKQFIGVQTFNIIIKGSQGEKHISLKMNFLHMQAYVLRRYKTRPTLL